MKTSIKILIGIVVLSFIGVLTTRVGLEVYAKNNPGSKEIDSKLTLHKVLSRTSNELHVDGNIRVIIKDDNAGKKEPYLVADSSLQIEIKDNTVTIKGNWQAEEKLNKDGSKTHIKTAKNFSSHNKVIFYNWVPANIHAWNNVDINLNLRNGTQSLKVECLNSSEFKTDVEVDSIEVTANHESNITLEKGAHYAKVNILERSRAFIGANNKIPGILTGNVKNASSVQFMGNTTISNLLVDMDSQLNKYQ
ncbi:MAG: hypothetical protein Q8928_14985 [Bacteroidota bacterium]|nr:hypothetical protein [Bacteroidota bacterium]